MALFNKIQQDMYTAMKAGKKERVTTLRVALARLKDKKIATGADLSDKDAVGVIRSLVKQHRESIEAYSGGGRQDLVDQEQEALDVLEPYLPQMMGADEVRTLVKDIIAETGAAGLADIGKVMPLVMQRSAGRADGKLAQGIVRELLDQAAAE